MTDSIDIPPLMEAPRDALPPYAKVHRLKCYQHYFEELRLGRKTFELRDTHDRCFQAGDEVVLRSTDEHSVLNQMRAARGFPATTLRARIVAVYTDLPGLQPGYAALQLERLELLEKSL